MSGPIAAKSISEAVSCHTNDDIYTYREQCVSFAPLCPEVVVHRTLADELGATGLVYDCACNRDHQNPSLGDYNTASICVSRDPQVVSFRNIARGSLTSIFKLN